MSATPERSPKLERQSLLFRDLASPISSSHRGGSGTGIFATPGQAAAVSALWRENFGAACEPPPPPAFTLDDRADFSYKPGLIRPPPSPEATPSPLPARGGAALALSTQSPFKSGRSGAAAATHVVDQPQQRPKSVGWWPAARSGEEKGKGSSPMDGVVQPGALITLPAPREVARPELQRNSLPTGCLDEKEWVTVYGFAPGDTKLVLSEFEKCGVVVKYIPGPKDANWMHILYENRYDAQKALGKHGVQINSVLMIGVKPMDPAQRQFLDDKLNGSNRGSFMVPLSPQLNVGWRSPAPNPMGATPQLYHLRNGSAVACDGEHHSAGAIASPTKSVMSKVMDLMFGI